MPLWLCVPLVFASLVAAPAPPQTVEIDRTVQHVYGTAILASDIRQVKLLRLLSDVEMSDDRILAALENRLLLLREVSRQSTTQPPAAAIAARRQTWAGAWPAGTDLPALMAKAGMNDQALDGWFRDDLRIAAYLDLRFGVTADQARATRLAELITELRRRANLSDRR
jgi:hypothetical protein